MKGDEASKRTPTGTLTFKRGHPLQYSYQIGQEQHDGTMAWGKSFTLHTSYYPGQASLQRVIVFSDMGLGAKDRSSEL
ncbi:hypothetical protein ZWY2020_004835 [Hordeum vulgare]|nr:hypothetical protein ZWY2020_004835 [Hordeum vulgare]